MASTSKNRKSIWDPAIVRGAAIGAVRKLNPRGMMGNPVMFVVEVGSVITTLLCEAVPAVSALLKVLSPPASADRRRKPWKTSDT